MVGYGFFIPSVGRNYLAGLLAGETLEISKVMVGKGRPNSMEELDALTDLVEPVAQATSTTPLRNGEQVDMVVEYRSDLNGGLDTGFWLNEFGIFAMDGDDEVMIYYGCLGDFPQWVSAYNEGAIDVRRFPVSISVTSGIQVSVEYPASAWMTSEDVADQIDTHNGSYDAHKVAFNAKQDKIENLQEKLSIVDDDSVAIVDKADNKTKRVLWSTIKSTLSSLFVPLTRKVNGKALSSNVTLTGENINVSGSDETSICSALSNKATNYGIMSSGDLLEWALAQDGSGTFLTNLNVTGTPAQGYYNGVLSVAGQDRGLMIWDQHGNCYTRNTVSGGWSGSKWIKYVTATPPQEYDLPLAEGWSGTAKYYKTQENVCVVSLDISKGSELITGESVGVVPAGFRPAYIKMSPASTFAPSGSTTIGISTDGSILLGDVSGQEQARNVYATIVYIAGN